MARASWQPTRSTSSRGKAVQPTATQNRRIHTVDHVQFEGLPVPPPDSSISIVESSIEPAHLDGQVSFSPMYEGEIVEGGVIYEGFPESGMGCDDPGCSGCDGGGCDGGGCDSGCSTKAWRPCITLCMPQDGWVSFEYLGWWQDGMQLPPLVTSSADPNIPRDQAGVLGDPTTRILAGNEKALTDSFNGGRLRFGVWLDRCHTWAIEGEYFELSSETQSFSATSSGNPILARPFFNTQTGLNDSQLVAYPNVLTGTVTAAARSELVGGGFHIRRLRRTEQGCTKGFFCGCPAHYNSRTELLFGYRFLQLKEGVVIAEGLVSTDTGNPGAFQIFDAFGTRNQFNGVDLGYMNTRTRGCWSLESRIRLAIGNNRQTVKINGQTTVNDPNNAPTVQTYSGGLLTQTSNIGIYAQDQFAVIPELNLKLGYQLTDRFQVTLGYTAIYWSNVVRPGEHIDLDVNTALLPPPADVFTGVQRPSFAFDTTDYWVQGISFGGVYSW